MNLGKKYCDYVCKRPEKNKPLPPPQISKHIDHSINVIFPLPLSLFVFQVRVSSHPFSGIRNDYYYRSTLCSYNITDDDSAESCYWENSHPSFLFFSKPPNFVTSINLSFASYKTPLLHYYFFHRIFRIAQRVLLQIRGIFRALFQPYKGVVAVVFTVAHSENH